MFFRIIILLVFHPVGDNRLRQTPKLGEIFDTSLQT